MAAREPANAALPTVPSPASRGDPISDVLETIRMRGALFFLWEPAWPYNVTVADGQRLSRHIVPGTERIVSYHIVTEGPCWASIHGTSPSPISRRLKACSSSAQGNALGSLRTRPHLTPAILSIATSTSSMMTK